MDLLNSCWSSCCLDCTRLLVTVTGVPLLTMALSKLHSTRLSVPVHMVSDKPHHPIDFAFPSREFGKKNQASAFKLDGLSSTWIHYNEENVSAYCSYWLLRKTLQRK